MRRIYFILLCFALTTLFISQGYASVKSAKQAIVFFDFKTQEKIYFQSENDIDTHYKEVKPGERLILALDKPAYYYYVDTRSGCHTIFLTPGSFTRIVETNGVVAFTGDNAKMNQFIQKHPSVTMVPKGIKTYSEEWKQYLLSYSQNAIQTLKSSKLPDEFIRIQAAYYHYSYLYQLLTGPDMARMFLKVNYDLPEDFYDDVLNEKFDDEALIYYPRCFTVVKESMERLEKMNVIKPDYSHFLQLYVDRMGNDKVKNYFLLRYLDFVLKAGYADDFPYYVSVTKPYLKGTADFVELNRLQKQYSELHDKYIHFVKGCAALPFTAKDTLGVEHRIADNLGKVFVLDFWFSGCIPCKAEMPYMENLAKEFHGKEIQFVAVSLDMGEQFVKAWKGLVDGKDTPILQVNVTNGFKSDVAKFYAIHSVPRIIIIDKQGKIVDAFARRPSDPKLRSLLLSLLEK